MSIIKQAMINHKEKIDMAEYRRLVFLHAPALGLLLDQLDAGVSPEPLEVMQALSQSVGYFTNREEIHKESSQLTESCPGRFCASC